MELRQLKYFVSAAKHLSFTTAANECFVAQTTMSQQIKELEKDLGVSLFTRKNNAIALTPEGKQLKKDAEKILYNCEQAEHNLLMAQKSVKTVLKLGYYGDGLGIHFPPIVKSISERLPDVRIQFHECRSGDILHDLEFGIVDCIINVRNERLKEPAWLDYALICRSPMEISAAPGVFPYPDGSLIDPDEELPLPLITLTSTVVQHIKHSADESNQISSLSNPYSSARDVLLTTACGQTLFLGPQYGRIDAYGLYRYKFRNVSLELPIYLMWKKDQLIPQITSILNIMKDYFETLGD